MTYDPGTSCRGNVECCLLCCLKLLIWICKGSKLAAPKEKRVWRPGGTTCASQQFCRAHWVPGPETKESRRIRTSNVDLPRKTPEALRRAGDLTSAEAAFSVARDNDEERLGEKST